MESITLKGERRERLGTKATRILRAGGRVPAVIYGHGKPPEALSLAVHDVQLALAHGARMLGVKLGRQTKQYLIKEVQYDHLDHAPIHLDLARVDLDERVRVRVGIELRGVPKGVSEGGVLEQYMADIEVECLVTDIPETLHPLVTELGLDDSFLVSDLPLPPNVIALAEPDERIATVRPVIEEVEVEAAAEPAAKEAEPEVIGRGRREEEEASREQKS